MDELNHTDFRLRTRKDGYFEVVWADPVTGSTRRKSCSTKDRKLAGRAMTRIVAEARTAKVGGDVTVGQLIDHYLRKKECEPTRTAHQLATIFASLRPVSEFLGNLIWDQLTQDRIDEYATWRSTHRAWKDHPRMKKSTRTVGRSTIDKDLRMLRVVMNLAHENRHIPQPVAFKTGVGGPVTRDEYLPREEVTQMLRACETRESQTVDVIGSNSRTKKKVVAYRRDRTHIAEFILLSLASAARKEAVLGLTWDRVHLAVDPKILDYRTGSVRGDSWIDFGKGNGNKRRPKVPVADNFELMAWLIHTRPTAWEHLDDFASDTTMETAEERTSREDNQRFVIRYRGRPIKDIKNGFKEVLRDAGVTKKVTPHIMKHTAITWLVQSGMLLSEIAIFANTSEKVLERTYSHHSPDLRASIGKTLSIRR